MDVKDRDAPKPSWDLLVALMGAPYGDDSVGTVLRLCEAVVSAGGRVQVWACGYATMLTQDSLSATKPSNVMRWADEYSSSAETVRSLVDRSAGSLRWSVCGFCSLERGATTHIGSVAVRPASTFGRRVRESATSVFVGVI